MSRIHRSRWTLGIAIAIASLAVGYACAPRQGAPGLVTGDAAQRVYVAPGTYDEFYAFLSGGFNGQVSVYGLP